MRLLLHRFILLANMVPISLVVSAEMVKFNQSAFIEWDRNIFSSLINKSTKCNSSTVHEDLGYALPDTYHNRSPYL